VFSNLGCYLHLPLGENDTACTREREMTVLPPVNKSLHILMMTGTVCIALPLLLCMHRRALPLLLCIHRRALPLLLCMTVKVLSSQKGIKSLGGH